MISLNELEQMNLKDRQTMKGLVDVRHISIDTNLPALERLENYLKDIQNPYYFLCGDVSVHVCFSDNGKDLSSQLKHYFSSCNH
ncbi:hypothetical protein KFZ56_01415 [Virgibacillus sp. NKC19-3]|uniref:DUF6870 family protein n=1 Tax=Virgibacillus saliphilus TaxID=2831674 RepID=UPI001C9B1DBA|nr:hypothetical protein [Virgibacillus sp. NKC19-3]MBY7141772.1 hypothetical protein [Virgibacillus sp. NKC19-3]